MAWHGMDGSMLIHPNDIIMVPFPQTRPLPCSTKHIGSPIPFKIRVLFSFIAFYQIKTKVTGTYLWNGERVHHQKLSTTLQFTNPIVQRNTSVTNLTSLLNEKSTRLKILQPPLCHETYLSHLETHLFV